MTHLVDPTLPVASIDPTQFAFLGMAVIIVVFCLGCLVGLKL
jgi:hypothetical protein